MTTGVFLLVLFAAFLHALWNALVKIDRDGLSVMAVIVAVQGVVSLLLAGFVPFPDATGGLFLLGAAALHTAYRLFLAQAYRLGDLSRVYPVARGTAPLIVAVLAQIFAGERPGPQALAAIIIIAVGIMSLSLVREPDGRRNARAILLALGTGLFSAVYTVVDGLGVRHLGSAPAYMVWVSLLDAIVFLPIGVMSRHGRLLPASAKTWIAGAAAGVTGFIAYWLVVWALSVAPMAQVSALRATSIGFALLLAVAFLKEPMNARRSATVIAIAVGKALLK